VVTEIDEYLNSWPTPANGWPTWLTTVPYLGSAHPLAVSSPSIEEGANCQRYAYAVLAEFGLQVPPVRSSDLLEHPGLVRVGAEEPAPLDLVLLNDTATAYGAHVGVHLAADQVLHLCAEIGRPAVWSYADFARRTRYRRLVTGIRAVTHRQVG
jgi:hypothetical protein